MLAAGGGASRRTGRIQETTAGDAPFFVTSESPLRYVGMKLLSSKFL